MKKYYVFNMVTKQEIECNGLRDAQKMHKYFMEIGQNSTLSTIKTIKFGESWANEKVS